MPNRTCSVPDCTKAHRARGLCATHYNQAHQPDRHRKVDVECAQCGDVVQKVATLRFTNRFCSLLCRDVHRNGGQPTMSRLPRMHPVMVLLHPLPAPREPAPAPVLRVLDCEWCGAQYSTTKASQRMCSRACKVKAMRVRRRGQERGWSSHYTWAEVMRLFIRLDRCCAYCHEVVDGQPEPDHVVPLSRGGANSITNILPSCSACNSDKRDLLLSEWNADRERRGLPARTTDDPRWIHLTSLCDAA